MALTKVTSGLISADASSVDLNIDAGTLYIDATNNRVGIGTTSPAAYLGFNAEAYQNGTEDSSSIRWNDVGTADSILQGYLIGTDGANLWVGANSYVDSGGGVVAFDTAKKSSYISVSSYIGGLAFGSAASGNPTEAMRIDSSGNVGINNTSPASFYSGADNLVIGSTSENNNGLTIATSNIGVGRIFFADTDSTIVGQIEYAHTANVMVFATAAAERMRIDSSGRLLVGTTSYLQAGNVATFSKSATGTGSAIIDVRNTESSTTADSCGTLSLSKASTTTSSSQRYIYFWANNFSQAMGAIAGNGAANVQFIAVSDERLKENIQPLSGSLDKVLALNPVSYDWKENGEHIEAGFVAQEVEQILPEYVTTEEDEDQTKGLTGGMTAGYIAVLTKAIQEQQVLIEQLQAEVALLKGE